MKLYSKFSHETFDYSSGRSEGKTRVVKKKLPNYRKEKILYDSLIKREFFMDVIFRFISIFFRIF